MRDARQQRAASSKQRAAEPSPASTHRDCDVLSSVRDTVVRCGRKPWWEEPQTVEARAGLAGKEQRQDALYSYDADSRLQAATRSLLRQKQGTSLRPSVTLDVKEGSADVSLSSRACSAVNRLSRGLPVDASLVGAAARRETNPPPQPAADDVARMLQARLRHRREHAASKSSLRPPGV